jgi:hypothetical protein
LSYKLYPGASVLALSQGEPVRELAANWLDIQEKLIHS